MREGCNMRTLIAAALVIVCANTYALRCGNTIVDVGSSVHEVRANCDVYDEYTVENNNADVVYITIKEGSITNKLTVIDGVVRSIDY
jgi:hypothetical protein